MGLFTKKEKISLANFCGSLSEEMINQPIIDGIDRFQVNIENLKKCVTESDPNFATVSVERLKAEIIVVRFELFGLVWVHQNVFDRAIEQSELTRRYLKATGRDDIWDGMGPYNEVIGELRTLYWQSKSTAFARAFRVKFNEWIVVQSEQSHAQGLDEKAVARAINRHQSFEVWNEGVTSGVLANLLCRRLGCLLNQQAKNFLDLYIQGMYGGLTRLQKTYKVSG